MLFSQSTSSNSEPGERPKKPRIRIVTLLKIFSLILLAVFVVGTIFLKLYFATPGFKRQVVRQLEKVMGTEVRIDKLEFQLTRGVSLSGLSIRDQTGEPAIVIDEFLLKYDFWLLLKRRLQIKKVAVIRPQIFLRELSPDKWNLAQLAKPAASRQEEPSSGFTLELKKLTVEDALVTVEKNGLMRLAGINLELDELDLEGASGKIFTNKGSPGSFSFQPQDKTLPTVKVAGVFLDTAFKATEKLRKISLTTSLNLDSIAVNDNPETSASLKAKLTIDLRNEEVVLDKLRLDLAKLATIDLAGRLGYSDKSPAVELNIAKAELNIEEALSLAQQVVDLEKLIPRLKDIPIIEGIASVSDFTLNTRLNQDLSLQEIRPRGLIQVDLKRLSYVPLELTLADWRTDIVFTPETGAGTRVKLNSLMEQLRFKDDVFGKLSLAVKTNLAKLKPSGMVEVRLKVARAFDGEVGLRAGYDWSAQQLSGTLSCINVSLDKLSRGRATGTVTLRDKFSLDRAEVLTSKVYLDVPDFLVPASPFGRSPQRLNLSLKADTDLREQRVEVSDVALKAGEWLDLNFAGSLHGWNRSRIELAQVQARIDSRKLGEMLSESLPKNLSLKGEYLLEASGRIDNVRAPIVEINTRLTTDVSELDINGRKLKLAGLELKSLISRSAEGVLTVRGRMKARRFGSKEISCTQLALNAEIGVDGEQAKISLEKISAQALGGKITGRLEAEGSSKQTLVTNGAFNLTGVQLDRLGGAGLEGELDSGVSFNGPLAKLNFESSAFLRHGRKQIKEKWSAPLTVNAGVSGSGSLLDGHFTLAKVTASEKDLGGISLKAEVSGWGRLVEFELDEAQLNLKEGADFAKKINEPLRPWEVNGLAKLSGFGTLSDFKKWQGEMKLALNMNSVLNPELELEVSGVNIETTAHYKEEGLAQLELFGGTDSIRLRKWRLNGLNSTVMIRHGDNLSSLAVQTDLTVDEVLNPENDLKLPKIAFRFQGEALPDELSLNGKGSVNLGDWLTTLLEFELKDGGRFIAAKMESSGFDLAHLKANEGGQEISGTVRLKAKYKRQPRPDESTLSKDILSTTIELSEAGFASGEKMSLTGMNGKISAAVIDFQRTRVKGKLGWQGLSVPGADLTDGSLVFQVDSNDLAQKQFLTTIKSLRTGIRLTKPKLEFGEFSLNGEIDTDFKQKSLTIRSLQVALDRLAGVNLEGYLRDWGNEKVYLTIRDGWLDYQQLMELEPLGRIKTPRFSGRGTFSGYLSSSLPQLRQGLNAPGEAELNQVIEGLSLDYQGLKAEKIKGAMTFARHGYKNNLSGQFELSGLEIKGKKISQGTLPKINFRVNLVDKKTLQLEKLEAVIEESGLKFNMKGSISLKKDVPSQLESLFEFSSTEEKPLLLPGLQARGKLTFPLSLTIGADKSISAEGKIKAEDLNVKFQDQLQILGINGIIPVTRKKTAIKNPAVGPLAVSSDYELLRQYFLNQERVANFRINELSFGRAAIKKLRLDVRWQNNRLLIGRMAGKFWEGDVTGALGADLTGGALRYFVKANLTDVNLKGAFGGEASIKENYFTSANLDIKGQGLEDIEGDVNITKIDRKIVDRLLRFLDPKGENPTILNAREQINRLGKVPKAISIKARQSAINVVLLLVTTKVGLVTSIMRETVNITGIPLKLLTDRLPKQ